MKKISIPRGCSTTKGMLMGLGLGRSTSVMGTWLMDMIRRSRDWAIIATAITTMMTGIS